MNQSRKSARFILLLTVTLLLLSVLAFCGISEPTSAPQPLNGWNFIVEAFNFNLEHLDIGTLDTPEWKFADRATALFNRVVIARVGLWGNHSNEAAYPQVFLDENNKQLNDSRNMCCTLMN